MKCPRCGKEIEDDSRFCKYCAAQIETDDNGTEQNDENYVHNDEAPYRIPDEQYAYRPPSKGRALVSVILFVSLLFICQSCVTSFYTSALMIESPYTIGSNAEETLDYYNQLMDMVNSHSAQILLISNLILLLLIFLIFQLRHKNPLEETSIQKINPLRFIDFALLGIALNVFISCTLSLLPLPEKFLESFEETYSGLYSGDGAISMLVEILSVAVVAGIVEEIIFRGIALKRLIPAFGNFGAVIISAAIFGLAHGTPVAIGYAFLLGILFGIIFVRYKSIVPTIFCHVFFNLTSYILMLVPDSAIFIVYIISIILSVVLILRIFVSHPTFYDVYFDTDRLIQPKNEAQFGLFERIREIRERGGEKNRDELRYLSDELKKSRRKQ